MPSYGSLFTGIGGFDKALDEAGWTCTWRVENDPDCRRVLERRLPGVPLLGDIQGTHAEGRCDGYASFSRCPRCLPAVDLVIGGFPCQDLSVAGRRAGLAGERSGLWHEFARILAELAPPWVCVENVPGLLSSNEGRDMGVIVARLAELGYGWAYRVLDAQYFGVAQRRRRVFIVGRLGDGPAAAQVLFEPASGLGDPAPRRASRQGSASPAAGGAPERGVPAVSRALSASDGGASGKPAQVSLIPQSTHPLASHPYGDHGAGDESHLIPAVSGPLGANGTGGGWRTDMDRSGAYIPEVARALNAQRDGYNDGSDQTYVPEIAWALQERDAKGADSDTKDGHLLVYRKAQKAHSADDGERWEADSLTDSLSASGMTRSAEAVVELAAPLSAGSHPGSNEPGRHREDDVNLVFEARLARNGRGVPSPLVPPLKAQSGQSGKGDGAPLLFSITPEGGQGADLRATEVEVAPALTPTAEGASTDRGARVVEPLAVRRLTPTECERLQGFPDGWTAVGGLHDTLPRDSLDDASRPKGLSVSDSARYRMLGNAVCVPVALWIARRMRLTHEGGDPNA